MDYPTILTGRRFLLFKGGLSLQLLRTALAMSGRSPSAFASASERYLPFLVVP